MLCKEILRKRKDHKVFSKLEKDDLKERKWYFIEDSTKNIKGPFNAEEMDQFFQIHKINPQTKIKRKLEDHDYFFLVVFVGLILIISKKSKSAELRLISCFSCCKTSGF